jgi:hypothetical protein
VHIGRRAHLVGVPQAPADVYALEPRHPIEELGDEHEHELGAALALRPGASQVRDARATEQGSLDRPAVGDPLDVALELAVVELSWGHSVPDRGNPA